MVVFTASMEIYGQGVADKLDNNRGILKRRYFRQHCTLDYGSYTKDLSTIVDDLSSVFILDNSPGAYRAYPGKFCSCLLWCNNLLMLIGCFFFFSQFCESKDNAIPIRSWFCDPSDTALLNLLPVLDALRFTSDVRSVLSRNLHLHKMWWPITSHLSLDTYSYILFCYTHTHTKPMAFTNWKLDYVWSNLKVNIFWIQICK